jgi:hypothetical protein
MLGKGYSVGPCLKITSSFVIICDTTAVRAKSFVCYIYCSPGVNLILRSEVFTEVKRSWLASIHGLVGRLQRFGSMYCLLLRG